MPIDHTIFEKMRPNEEVYTLYIYECIGNLNSKICVEAYLIICWLVPVGATLCDERERGMGIIFFMIILGSLWCDDHNTKRFSLFLCIGIIDPHLEAE